MTLDRHNSESGRPTLSWEDLTIGAPTIIGFAGLCSQAMANCIEPPPALSLPAQAILFAAQDRGSLEIKAIKNAFDSAQRLLAVHVERSLERVLVFRSRNRPQFTIEMLDGFRELCTAGLVMHQLGHEFSLSQRGFVRAKEVVQASVQACLDQGVELEFGD